MNNIEQRLWAIALDIHLEVELDAKRLSNDPSTIMRYVGALTDAQKLAILKPIYTQMRTEKEQQRDRLTADFAAVQAKEQQRLDDDITALLILER